MSATAERKAYVRQDGKEKVTGSGRYTADLTAAGQLHASFRYADHARARILSIDTTRAQALPGVFAVVTHEDVPDVLYGQMVKDRRLFAKDEVRFDADVIAAVAALSAEIAQAAATLIDVQYEPLQAICDPEAAAEPDAPLVHAQWESYEGEDALGRHGNILGHSTIVKGDAAAAMAGAEVVVSSRYVADGSHGVPIEPRAVLAEWHGDRVTIWSSTQTPFAARSGVAHTLGIPESNVRIVVPLLGGGFGSKCDFHFEAHVAALARKAGRPVKLVFSRTEEFIAPDHRRESIAIELETGARRDGTLVARRGRLVLDGGAYCGEGGFFAQMAAMHAIGPYLIDTVDVDSKLVYTNNQPSGSIRAPTAPQTCWAVEQHMDEVADAIGMDPVELRRRTLIEEGTESATRQVFGPIGMKETLERAVEMIGYGDELPENEAIGISCGWWPSFGVPSGAYVKLNGDGTGDDRDRRAGERERRRHGTAAARGGGARHAARATSRSSTRTPTPARGTWAPPARRRRSTTAERSSRPPTRSRTSSASSPPSSSRSTRSTSSSSTARCGSRARRTGRCRSRSWPGPATAILGKGSGPVPEAPDATPDSGCVGRLGMESFLEPQLITHAAHVRVDPETGVVRVLRVAAAHDSGMILNRIGRRRAGLWAAS